jgi:hypothetical protein
MMRAPLARAFLVRALRTFLRRTWFRARRLWAALAVALPTSLPAFSAQADNPTAVTVTVTGIISQDNTEGHINSKFVGQPYTLSTTYNAAALTKSTTNICPPNTDEGLLLCFR